MNIKSCLLLALTACLPLTLYADGDMPKAAEISSVTVGQDQKTLDVNGQNFQENGLVACLAGDTDQFNQWTALTVTSSTGNEVKLASDKPLSYGSYRLHFANQAGANEGTPCSNIVCQPASDKSCIEFQNKAQAE